jgi:DNA-binding MarR family transcriptional regulator
MTLEMTAADKMLKRFAEHGLYTIQDIRLTIRLYRGGSMQLSDAASFCGLVRNGGSHLCARFERLGLARRMRVNTGNEANVVHMRLTPKGRRMVRLAIPSNPLPA